MTNTAHTWDAGFQLSGGEGKNFMLHLMRHPAKTDNRGFINKSRIAFLVGTFAFWSLPLTMTDAREKSPGAGESRNLQTTSNGDPGHWGYEGIEGPGHWAMADLSYKTCETGRQQSPIHLVIPRHGENQEELTFHYQPTSLTVRNNGHTIQVNNQGGSSLRLNGKSYKLWQFHFHDPSEHHIDVKRYPNLPAPRVFNGLS